MKPRTGGKRFVCAAIFCLLSLPACRQDSSSHLVGSYSTVSESEWNIILTLKRGGVALIEEESWAPGEYENRSVDKTEARWRWDGSLVILEYGGLVDRLFYDAKLSLAILGYKGRAPGLIQQEAFAESSILRNYPLWKLPHRFGNAPPSR